MGTLFMFLGKVLVLTAVISLQIYLWNNLFAGKESGRKRRMDLLWSIIVLVGAVAFVVKTPGSETFAPTAEGIVFFALAFILYIAFAWKKLPKFKEVFLSVLLFAVNILTLFLYYHFF